MHFSRPFQLLLLLCFLSAVLAEEGCFPNNPRTDCGYNGITQQQCQDKGCCWMPVNPNPQNLPWCANKTDGTLPPPWTPPSGAPFNSTEMNDMMTFFLKNIDVCCLDSTGSGGTQQCNDCGGVVAAPDYNTGPGGSYVYHWMRDGALTMRALMMTNNDTSLVNSKMQNYVQWVLTNQVAPDPNGIDVRVEPKFMLPSPGTVFPGSWCRPQTDGPGLRASTLIDYANRLLAAGESSYVKQYLWTGSSSQYNGGAIKYDLDWIVANWESSGCDLWEEISSTDFFWNRYTMRYALTVGADLATKMGDSSSASSYTSTANAITPTVEAHWNGDFVYESTNREQDAAVILGFNNGYLGDDVFAPSSSKVAATISTLSGLFNSSFYINQLDTQLSVPGILYGRYQGDSYDGGNPWILTTCALAQLFYDGASDALVRLNALPNDEAMDYWSGLFGHRPSTVMEFANAALQAGDDVLYRVRYHVESYGFHLSEQIDRSSGSETSAKDLTWSYATLLKAMHSRSKLADAMEYLK